MANFLKTKVDSIDLNNTSKSIDDEIEQLKIIYNFFAEDLSTSLDSHWSGASKMIFDRRKVSLIESISQIIKELEELNETLKNCSKNYEATDGKVKIVINNLYKIL